MNAFVAQMFGSEFFEMALTAAFVVGGILFLGAIVSFAVFGYQSIKGDGMKDPREVVPEKVEDDDELTEGSSDDEWDYY